MESHSGRRRSVSTPQERAPLSTGTGGFYGSSSTGSGTSPQLTPRARFPQPSSARFHSTPRSPIYSSNEGLNSMYSFEETDSNEMFSRQNTTINNLQSETSDLRNEANALRDITNQQQLQIEALKQQLVDLQSQPQQAIERLPRSISSLIRRVYGSISRTFLTTERFDSVHNLSVRRILEEELHGAISAHGKETVTRGIARLFQDLKRKERENEPSLQVLLLEEARKKRKNARRRRLYVRRSKVTNGDSERKKWKEISSLYMTDESSDEEALVVHNIPWRSVELDGFIRVLDERNQTRSQLSLLQRPPLKPRRVSTPSTRPPPAGPQWAILQD